MRYQNQQKGLFTFYKEQQLYQSQLQVLKKRKIEAQLEAQNAKIDKKITTSTPYSYPRFSPQKYKASSQPAFNEEQSIAYHRKSPNIQKIGNSVIIINRKGTENGDQTNFSPTKQMSYQQRGYFLQNKNIQFQQLQKFKNSNRQSHHRKKSLIRKKIEFFKPQETSRRNQTKLPNINKIQENNSEETKQNPIKNRGVGSSLRFYGGELMKYIRGNLASDMEIRQQSLKREVNFIEMTANYSRESPSKKLQQLNQQQKRLLQILHRYRQPQT